MSRTEQVLTSIALALALFLPSVAEAGGWLVITLDRLPGRIVAGEEVMIGFLALQHGHTPFRPPPGIPDAPGMPVRHPQVKLWQPASGTELRVVPLADGPPGHYTAHFVLPAPGAWEWSVLLWAEHPMPTLTVAAEPGRPRLNEVVPSAAAGWAGPLQVGGGLLWLLAIAILASRSVGVLSAGGLRRWRPRPEDTATCKGVILTPRSRRVPLTPRPLVEGAGAGRCSLSSPSGRGVGGEGQRFSQLR